MNSVGIIYKIVNKQNGKIYIGQTSKTLKKRMQAHLHGSQLIDKEIMKFGIDNFEVEILKYCTTKTELNEREKHYIRFYNSKSPNGYNLNDGGNCGVKTFSSQYKSSSFNEKLRYLRKHQELTQIEIAKRLNMNSATYSKYETGTTEPDIATIKKLANFFDVSIDYLLENDRTISDSDEIVDFNNFILNGRYTINSKFLNDKERQHLNNIINAIYEEK